jgi:hypothetical protein
MQINGLYDMGGNVWQLCKDSDDSAEDLSVLRGGSWEDTVDIGHKQRLSSYLGQVSIIGRVAGILPLGNYRCRQHRISLCSGKRGFAASIMLKKE